MLLQKYKKVVAKDWLLDPTNILIESTGGNVLTGDSC